MIKYAIIAVAGASAITGVFLYGRAIGKDEGRVEQLEATVQAERDRNEIDSRVQNLGDYELCIRVGGLQSDCEQLRGLDEAPKD